MEVLPWTGILVAEEDTGAVTEEDMDENVEEEVEQGKCVGGDWDCEEDMDPIPLELEYWEEHEGDDDRFEEEEDR